MSDYEYDDRDEALADYEAEMALEREHASRQRYVEAFDAETGSGYYPVVFQKGMGYVRAGYDLAHGPNPLPICEGCGKTLTRDTDGVFDAHWGVFYCSSECQEAQWSRAQYSYEPQEDFHADLGIGPSDWD